MKKIIWVVVGCALFAPTSNAAEVEVSFVGCPSDGQAGDINPPAGNARKVHLDGPLPVALAYYKGEGSGVFAPAGWHCRVWYGSNGSFIIVTPGPIEPPYFPPPSYAGPVVELSTDIGGTSGRFAVARLGGMLFPALTKRFVKDVEREEKMAGEKPERKKKYRTDSLEYLSPRVVRFRTPANTEGLGTEGRIKVANQPIQGIAVLQESEGDPPDVSVLRVRLGERDDAAVPTILKLNAECMKSNDACQGNAE